MTNFFMKESLKIFRPVRGELEHFIPVSKWDEHDRSDIEIETDRTNAIKDSIERNQMIGRAN